jgi:CRISPR-associated protein Cmr5
MTSATDTSAPTLEQRRAKHAWDAVQYVVQAMENGTEEDKAKVRDFAGQAKHLPMRIMAAGLGQALTFLLAKKYALNLLEAIGDWVLDKRTNPDSQRPRPAPDALIQLIVNGDSNFLRRATDETLAYLRWLIRFADAVLTDDNTGREDE